jgi:hypothetical protein
VKVRVAGDVLAAAGDVCVGVALDGVVPGLVGADDEQPARRAIMMTNAARAGVSPIRRVSAGHEQVRAAKGGSRESAWMR